MQFRMGRYAVIADISKAFHRIKIDARDQPYVKFLWTNEECNSQLTYVFIVVIFGATCSPCLLQQVLLTHLTNHVDGKPFVSKFYVFASEPESIQNVLGLGWDIRSDTLHVTRGDKIPEDLDSWQPTKRLFLSALSSVFDPLGLLNPILIKGKIFLQTLWKHITEK